MSGGGSRASIPSGVRKTIQNIKEITDNHTDEEIYAMLKECSMDPNETAQKLLLQDPFHEVKRKRDRRKENLNNKESAESRWKPGMQGRGSKGGRVNSSARYVSHDAGGGRNLSSGRDNGTNQVMEKGIGPSFPKTQESKIKEKTQSDSSITVTANGPSGVASENASTVNAFHLPSTAGNQTAMHSSYIGVSKLGSSVSLTETNKDPTILSETGDKKGQPSPASTKSSGSMTPTSSSAVCFSSSDPVLVPSNDSRLPSAVSAIKREVGSQRSSSEPNAAVHAENKSTAGSELSSHSTQSKMSGRSLGAGKNQPNESSQPPSTPTHGGTSVSRPSSNYSSRSQQIIGLQKVSLNKEWKPKPTSSHVAHGTTASASEVSTTLVEAGPQSRPATSILDSEEATSKLQEKLEELHLPQRQHVIIPNHIHVPDSERTKLSFGSFDASFGVTSSNISGPESEKSSTPLSETSQGIEGNVEEQAVSDQNALATAEEGDYRDHPQIPTPITENLSGEGDVSTSAVPEYNEPKQENSLLSGGHQYSMVHTPNYNYGFVPPMIGSQLAPFENAESQARDVSRLPSFVVQQPFDPTSYYGQFYRSSADSDGRVSPFPSPGVATKYNGNVAVLPPPTSQSAQEGGNSLVLSTPSPTPLVTQAAGLMQSSIAVTQQPVPVFRPPAGVHISHYPPNYIPYGHYFSPFYVPPPAIHQFLSNGAFSQQPQAGGVYPAPPAAAAAAGVKYSLPQYKPGTNTGNSLHIGMPNAYGLYGSSPAGYNPTSATTAGNSTTNEDLGGSQFKDNIYLTGQQSEGSAVWIAAPGRDISSLPASSFYNLPPQGQHVTFAPTQAGHGSFASMYHPQTVTAATVHPLLQQTQTMAGAVDIVGPTSNVYQQPQHAQINWPSNY